MNKISSAGGLLGWLIAAFLCLYPSQPPSGNTRTLKAERFDITDKAGKTKAIITADDDGLLVSFWSEGRETCRAQILTPTVGDDAAIRIKGKYGSYKPTLMLVDGHAERSMIIDDHRLGSTSNPAPREYRTVREYDKFRDATTVTLNLNTSLDGARYERDAEGIPRLEISYEFAGKTRTGDPTAMFLVTSRGAQDEIVMIIDGKRYIYPCVFTVDRDAYIRLTTEDLDTLADASSIEIQTAPEGSSVSKRQFEAIRGFAAELKSK